MSLLTANGEQSFVTLYFENSTNSGITSDVDLSVAHLSSIDNLWHDMGSSLSGPIPATTMSRAEKIAVEIQMNVVPEKSPLKAPPLPPRSEKGQPTKPPPPKSSLLHERTIQETMDAIDNLEEIKPRTKTCRD